MESKKYCRIERVEIWSFVNTKMTKPIDKDELKEFEALETRAQRVIMDIVKDHLIPHLEEIILKKKMCGIL